MQTQPDQNFYRMPNDIKTYLAWTFKEVLPGTFRRNKAIFAHLNYPILAPLPSLKSKTRPIEECRFGGPFIYFVLDGVGRICYIGKSKEPNVIKRWVRPGVGGPASHYWTHSIPSGGSTFNIAEGLRGGKGPFTLRYTTLSALLPIYGSQFGISSETPSATALELMEYGLVNSLSPLWNK